MSEKKRITLEDVKQASQILKGQIEYTPLGFSKNCSKWLDTPIHVKYENLQMTGSFKVRGAFNKLHSLTDKERRLGVVASSAGNHAQGVAYSASQLGVQAHIVMPKYSSLVKQEATRGYGAKVHLYGEYYDESYQYAKKLQEENNHIFVHPFDDEKVIAGQGTVGLEIFESLKNVDSIIVPIGGGGLMSGIATVAKTINPKCRIYGCVSESAAGMMGKFKNDPQYKFNGYPTIADGIAVKSPNEFIYENYIKNLVDDIVSVSDDDIAEAMVFLLERAKTVVEGSGGITLAAVKKAKWKLGENNVIVLSGGNVDLNLIASIIEKGLSKNGRLLRIRVRVPDLPGQLVKLTKIAAEHGANILEVQHDRIASELRVRETIVELLIETISFAHGDLIKKSIEELGADIL